MPNNLPQGWVECQLGDICNLDNGSKVYNANLPLLDVKYLRGKKEAINVEKGVLLNNGDFVILVDGENSGEIFSIYEQGIMGSTFKKLIFSDYINVDFAKFKIMSKQKMFKLHKVGSAIPHLNKKLFKSLQLLLPPLNEQKRIVEKIESEFAKIDEGLEHLKNAKEQIKQYRQSVLKSAFEGKLYKTSEWTKKNIGEITSKIIGGGTPSKNITQYYEGEIPFMTVKDMTSSRPIDTEWHITKEAVENSSTNIIPKDTIIIATRVGLGKIVRVNFATTINQDLKALILKECIDKDFCEYSIIYKTPEIIAKGRGTTVKGITLEELKDIKFNLPSLNEQKKIVEEIKKRFAVADEVEKAVEQNIEKAKQLKQSILKKAFEGRLVPQDPTDEPASKLLEKIKQERKENDRK